MYGRPGASKDPRVKVVAGGVAALLLVLSTLTHAMDGEANDADRVNEYQVKAAILYNLAKFVDWPGDAFADPLAPLSVCVLGADPFGTVLDDTLRGRMVGRRVVVARRLAEVAGGCHVLFVANSERKRLAAILDRLRTESVLTVGEADGFAEQGGMIGLLTDGDRVRFEINVDAAEHARLKLSARLMALASSIRRSGGPGR